MVGKRTKNGKKTEGPVDKRGVAEIKSLQSCDGEDVRHPRFRDAAVGASRGKGPEISRSRAGRKKGYS